MRAVAMLGALLIGACGGTTQFGPEGNGPIITAPADTVIQQCDRHYLDAAAPSLWDAATCNEFCAPTIAYEEDSGMDPLPPSLFCPTSF